MILLYILYGHRTSNILQHVCRDAYTCKPSSRFLWCFLLWSHFVGPTGVWQSVSWSSRPTVDANTSECLRVPHWNSQQHSGITLCYSHEMAGHFELSLQQRISFWFILLCLPQRSLSSLNSLSTKKLLRGSLRYYVMWIYVAFCIQRPVGRKFQAELIARTFGPWCSWQSNQTWQIRIFLRCASRLYNS